MISVNNDTNWFAQRSDSSSQTARILSAPKTSGVVVLSQVEPGRYVNFKARLVSFGYKQIRDEMGEKTILSGVVEDQTFRYSLKSHRLFDSLERDRIYLFGSVYAHSFPNLSIALVLTEYSRIQQCNDEDPRNFYWVPKAGQIDRPVWNVTMSGMVTKIFSSSSGLVKRCNGCRRVIYESCPKGCSSDWSWDLRISCQLSDQTGSMRTVLARHVAARILSRSVSEILYVASSPDGKLEIGQREVLSYVMTPPADFEVIEVSGENASRLRSSERVLVSDGFNLAYMPSGSSLDDVALSFSTQTRKLESERDPNDARILRRLVERALQLRISAFTSRPMTNGLFLLDEPLSLYNCEAAKLVAGFRTALRSRGPDILLEVLPEAFIVESVLDYANWRRSRGASAYAIEKYLLERRPIVRVAPSGRMGKITEVDWAKAGETRSSDADKRNLVEYWDDVYGVAVGSDETPLLKVQPVEASSSSFTYPPSAVFFDQSSLHLTPGLRKLVETKARSLIGRTCILIDEALGGFKLGDCQVGYRCDNDSSSDVRQQILSEVQQKLFGKKLRARGQVVKFDGERLFFLPDAVYEVS